MADPTIIDTRIRVMTVSLSARVSVPESVLIREIDGEYVVLNLDTETYYGLNGTATRMWAALVEADNLQAAAGRLADEYEVAPERLIVDLVAFQPDVETLGNTVVRSRRVV